MTRVSWFPILERAAELVRERGRVTLRQLFYLLTSEGTLPHSQSRYKALSDYRAQARRGDLHEDGLKGGARQYIERHGAFPSLVDNTRSIRRRPAWDGPRAALRSWMRQYRRKRLAGFDRSIWIVVEKNTVENVVAPWFLHRGLPVVALRGYSSQTFVDHVADRIASDPRPAVVLYAGDLDPSGVDIERDLQERCGNLDTFERVAVTPELVAKLDLSKNPAPENDSRNDAFRERFGDLFQVEVEAIDPPVLRKLYEDALAPYWQADIYERAKAREEADLSRFRAAMEVL